MNSDIDKLDELIQSLTVAREAAVNTAKEENPFANNSELVEPANAILERYKEETKQALLQWANEQRLNELKLLPATKYKSDGEVSHLSVLLQNQHIKERIATLKEGNV